MGTRQSGLGQFKFAQPARGRRAAGARARARGGDPRRGPELCGPSTLCSAKRCSVRSAAQAIAADPDALRHEGDRRASRRAAAEGAEGSARPARPPIGCARRCSRCSASSTERVRAGPVRRHRGAWHRGALRGAERVVFVERDASAVAALRANLARTRARRRARHSVRVGDALRCAAQRTSAQRDIRSRVRSILPTRHAQRAWGRAVGGSAGAARARRRAWSSRAIGGRRLELALDTIAQRRYGDTMITIHRLPVRGRG